MVGRRVYDLNVASILGKTLKGQTYYYLREVARVGGKPKVISQRYLGKAGLLPRPAAPRLPPCPLVEKRPGHAARLPVRGPDLQ